MTVESLKLTVKSLICHSRENGNPVLYDFPLLSAQHLDSCRSLSRTQIRGRNDRKFVPRHSPIYPFTNSKGFTLIETIMVMVIAVILAAVVAVRWSPFDTIKLNSATRKVAADIRYAQKVAISTQARAAITFNANGYDVYQDITVPTRAQSPGDPCSTDSSNYFVVNFLDSRCSNYSGVTIPTNPLTIAFNSLGNPVDATTGADLATQTVTVNYNGSKSITIEAGTGRVSY